MELTYLSPSCDSGTEVAVPSRRLLAAIIRRAILDFVLYHQVSKEEDAEKFELGADAAEWIWFDGSEPYDEEGRYTFIHICNLLGLDPSELREQALVLTRQDLHRFNGEPGPA